MYSEITKFSGELQARPVLHAWAVRTISSVSNKNRLLIKKVYVYFRGRTLKNRHESQSLSYGEVWAGVTYTVPRRATINAPPPMGPLGGLMGDPGRRSANTQGGVQYPRGVNPNPSYLLLVGFGALLKVFVARSHFIELTFR